MAQPKDFGFGEEQLMLKDSARRFMEDKAPINALRAATKGTEDPYLGDERSGHYDQDAWKEMIELGWTALAVPEEAGGVGMNLVTAVAVAEELGRAAMPSPLTMTLLSTFVLREAGTAEANQWLERIAGGLSMTLAVHGKDDFLELDSTDVSAAGGQLSGTSWYVQDVQKVDAALVAAKDGDSVKLYCVELGADGISMQHDRIVDLTRDQGRISFDGTAADQVSDAGVEVLKAAMPALLTLISADTAGACEWLLQATAEYAKVRTQFDRPIGFFQAVKHPIVNMMINTDETRSLVYAAACTCDTEPEKAELSARLAKSSASDTGEFCANRATQLHGGIGFTWEHDVQIYHKRVMHSQQLFGDGVWQRAKAADLL